MRPWIVILPLLLAASACAGGASPDPLTTGECDQLSGIAYSSGLGQDSGFEEDVGLFSVGTSVEDLGDALSLRDSASENQAALASFAERVPDSIKADVQALEGLYADWASAVEKYGGELPSDESGYLEGGFAVEAIRDAPSPSQGELADSAASVYDWANTDC